MAVRLDGEELSLVGLDGVQEGVEVRGAGSGESGGEEVQAARSAEDVPLRGIF